MFAPTYIHTYRHMSENTPLLATDVQRQHSLLVFRITTAQGLATLARVAREHFSRAFTSRTEADVSCKQSHKRSCYLTAGLQCLQSGHQSHCSLVWTMKNDGQSIAIKHSTVQYTLSQRRGVSNTVVSAKERQTVCIVTRNITLSE